MIIKNHILEYIKKEDQKMLIVNMIQQSIWDMVIRKMKMFKKIDLIN